MHKNISFENVLMLNNIISDIFFAILRTINLLSFESFYFCLAIKFGCSILVEYPNNGKMARYLDLFSKKKSGLKSNRIHYHIYINLKRNRL